MRAGSWNLFQGSCNTCSTSSVLLVVLVVLVELLVLVIRRGLGLSNCLVLLFGKRALEKDPRA